MTKTVAEWDVHIAETPDEAAPAPKPASLPSMEALTTTNGDTEKPAPPAMPGLEQGVVKFARKPAKMGADYIFWVPRVYIKNGLVDPAVEYEVYLKRVTRRTTTESGREKQ
jgi:hypothetical protein